MPATPGAIYDRLAQYRSQLAQWRDRIPEWVRDELTRLNAGTLDSDWSTLRSELRRLEQDLERLIADVNESGLYQLPLRADMLTSLRQRKFLEQLIDQFAHTESHLEYYRDFYRWQRHWFGLPARLRRVARRLLSLPEKNWPALFSSWYFEQCLRHSDLPFPPAAADGAEVVDQLRRAERDYIDRQPWITAKAKRWKPVPTEEYKTFWRQRPRALQDRFPVWLTTPEGARHLALGNVRFPDLIVENAAGLDPVDWEYPAERLLVTTVVPAPKGYTEIRLDGPHRYGPLQPLFVGGPDSSNPGEVVFCTRAEAASRMLERYRQFGQSLAETERIALTALDDTVLDQLKQAAGLPEGLVYHPSELAGVALDRLLIYGPAPDPQTNGVGPWELIDTLLSTRQRMTLFSGVGDEDLASALIAGGLSTSFIWAAAVRYVDYRNAADEPAAAAIASETHTRLQRRQPGAHPLLREIATKLSALDDRLNFVYDQPWRTLLLPAVATLPDDRRLVLLPEGAFAEAPPHSPVFHWQHTAALEQAGYEVVSIDTLAWWQDPATAAQDLLADWGLSGRKI